MSALCAESFPVYHYSLIYGDGPAEGAAVLNEECLQPMDNGLWV